MKTYKYLTGTMTEELNAQSKVTAWVGQAAFTEGSGVEYQHLTEAHDVLLVWLKAALMGKSGEQIIEGITQTGIANQNPLA